MNFRFIATQKRIVIQIQKDMLLGRRRWSTLLVLSSTEEWPMS
jgi:hypothetical protein